MSPGLQNRWLGVRVPPGLPHLLMIDTAPRREEQAFAMNRETKRAMARQQKTADPQRLQQLRKQQLERQRAGGRDGQQGTRRSRLRGVGSFGSAGVAALENGTRPHQR